MHQANDPTINSSPKNTVSERKLAANRANARLSTGPRTEEGKARSAMNSLRHGILAKAAFNGTIEREERRPEFEALLAGLAQEFQPHTMTEVLAVQQLAGCYWKLAKVWNYEQERAYCEWNLYDGSEELRDCTEDNVFEKMEDGRKAQRDGKFLEEAGLIDPTIPRASAATILRYQGAINTMMTRCLALLERRRKERMNGEEALEELDYINEAIVATPAAEQSGESSGEDGEAHERTQKAATEAAVSSPKASNPTTEAPAASLSTPPKA